MFQPLKLSLEESPGHLDMAVVVSRSAPYVEVSRINENVLSVFQDSGQGSVNLVEGIADGSRSRLSQ